MRWGITGHIDLDRPTRRLVAAQLMKELAADDGAELVGVTSLAAGTDQVFAWVVVALGGQLEFVRPCARIEETVSGPDLAGMRAGALLAGRTIVELAYDEPSEQAFLDAGQDVVDRCDRLLAVWDGRPAGGRGGTADIVAYAERQQRPWTLVWPDGARRG